MWQGFQAVTNLKMTGILTVSSNPSLAEEFNVFFTLFDRDNINIRETDRPAPDHQELALDTNEVRKALCCVKARKALGPDDIPGMCRPAS